MMPDTLVGMTFGHEDTGVVDKAGPSVRTRLRRAVGTAICILSLSWSVIGWCGKVHRPAGLLVLAAVFMLAAVRFTVAGGNSPSTGVAWAQWLSTRPCPNK